MQHPRPSFGDSARMHRPHHEVIFDGLEALSAQLQAIEARLDDLKTLLSKVAARLEGRSEKE